MIDNSKKTTFKLSEKIGDYELDWDKYYDHHVINDFLDALAKEYDFVETLTIGKSYEGKDMKVVKIGRAGEGAPNIWIEAGMELCHSLCIG
jgi:hypothetical protein